MQSENEAIRRLYREVASRIHEIEWITTSRDLLASCETEQAWLHYLQQLKEIPRKVAMKEIDHPRIENGVLQFQFPTPPVDSQSNWYRMAHFSEL